MEDLAVSRNAASVAKLQRRLERAFLWLRPDGGQGRARRNAWSAMVADSQRRQGRMLVAREIGPAVAAASLSVPRPARSVGERRAARAH